MASSVNRYPIWKYLLILAVIVAAFIYAAPNLFGEDPAVQIRGLDATVVNDQTLTTVNQALQSAHLAYKNVQLKNETLLYRFPSLDTQLKAKEQIQQTLGDHYLVALNLTPATPQWLSALGAMPMKYGLDLRGGVSFLLQVDVDAVVKQRIEGDLHGISQALREAHIRYAGMNRRGDDQVVLQFRSEDALNAAYDFVTQHYTEFTWEKPTKTTANMPANTGPGLFVLQGVLAPNAMVAAKQETLDQAMNTLRNRVNELGVSEAIVQQQGADRVSVELPGIQDTAQAKNIIGKTATLEFRMVDTDHDAALAQKEGAVPQDTQLFAWQDQPLLLKNQIILRGASIVSATTGVGEDGRSNVSVRLNGTGDSLFTKATAENIGKPMAVVYVETKPKTVIENGKPVTTYQTDRTIISVATIQSALGGDFQITGLTSQTEASNLALLLRAGALPAPVSYLEERVVGATLGEQNIHMGVLSVEVGLALVVIFMAVYYGLMGIIADIALLLNLVLIVAALSLLGATLTLPGIAGIVLTMGMAVDANVLIFERIREELRRGLGVQASIHAGYDRAFITIMDANITTLIVMMILFSLGAGIVKGIAITVTIGLLTSMFTAIAGTRAAVNLIYGQRAIKQMSIGI